MASCMSEKPGPEVAVMPSRPASDDPMQAQMDAISSSICMNTPPTRGSSYDHGLHDLRAGGDGIAGEEAHARIQSAEGAGPVALDKQAALVDLLTEQMAVPEFHVSLSLAPGKQRRGPSAGTGRMCAHSGGVAPPAGSTWTTTSVTWGNRARTAFSTS